MASKGASGKPELQDTMPGNVRLIVEVQDEDTGKWAQVDTLPMTRRFGERCFSTGAIGYNAAGRVGLPGPDGNVEHTVSASFVEPNTKGMFHPTAKADETKLSIEERRELRREQAQARYRKQ